MRSSMRVGDFKLIWRHEDDTVELYNLADDLGESKNLASVESERAAEMTKQLKKWLKKTNANMPRPNPNYDPLKTD